MSFAQPGIAYPAPIKSSSFNASDFSTTPASSTGSVTTYMTNAQLSGSLSVEGNTNMYGDLTVAGNLTVGGSTTTVTTNMIINGDLDIVGGATAPSTTYTAEELNFTQTGATDRLRINYDTAVANNWTTNDFRLARSVNSTGLEYIQFGNPQGSIQFGNNATPIVSFLSSTSGNLATFSCPVTSGSSAITTTHSAGSANEVLNQTAGDARYYINDGTHAISATTAAVTDLTVTGNETIGTLLAPKTLTLYGTGVQNGGAVAALTSKLLGTVKCTDTAPAEDELRFYYDSFTSGLAASNQYSFKRYVAGSAREALTFGGVSGEIAMTASPGVPLMVLTAASGIVYPLTTFNAGLTSTGTLTATNAATVGTTLGVTGLSTLGSLSVTNGATFNGQLTDASGNMTGSVSSGSNPFNGSGVSYTMGTVTGGWSRLGKVVHFEMGFPLTYTYTANANPLQIQGLAASILPAVATDPLGGLISITDTGTGAVTFYNAMYDGSTYILLYKITNGAVPVAATNTDMPASGTATLSANLFWARA